MSCFRRTAQQPAEGITAKFGRECTRCHSWSKSVPSVTLGPSVPQRYRRTVYTIPAASATDCQAPHFSQESDVSIGKSADCGDAPANEGSCILQTLLDRFQVCRGVLKPEAGHRACMHAVYGSVTYNHSLMCHFQRISDQCYKAALCSLVLRSRAQK